jgi:hypothetical protein
MWLACLIKTFPCTHPLTLQRGVTSAPRHSENITCRGVTSATHRAALSHSFDYISTTWKENVIGLLCACSRRSWLSYNVADISYKLLLHFFLSSRILGFLFAVPNFTGGFMCLWNKEMIYETTVIVSHHIGDVCSFGMVYDITLISIDCLFLHVCFGV